MDSATSTTNKALVWCALVAGLLAAQSLSLPANPVGGKVASGTATITTQPGIVTVSQSTGSAIINWQDFSIASGELTKFEVPTSSSATLNRVTGGNLSTIYGTLQSNGQVYLLNPNGILIGATGQIDTAGFIGSTLSLTDAQFNQGGGLTFSGGSSAAITNQGAIHAANGDVYLIAAQVNNGGTISAPQGTVGLAAGTQVLLQQVGDQHLFIEAGPTSNSAATGVNNTGSISAAAAELRAAGGNAYALAINNSGNIAATGVATVNGQVYLTSDGGDITNTGSISATQASGSGGTVVVNAYSSTGATPGTLLDSGTITATGTTPGTTGGTVELLGNRVGVTGQGLIDVSGEVGGGTALIGGSEHGADPDIPNATQTYLGPDATIKADALNNGNGGDVILWATDTTQFYGNISVRGGPAGGNGGFVETSGAYLDTQSAPDLSAPNGTGGTWLLDPINLNIVATGTSTAPDTSNVFSPTLSANTLTVAILLGALGSGDVTIEAVGDNDSSIIWQPGANLSYGSLSSGTEHTLSIFDSGVFSMDGVTIANGTTSTTSLNLVINEYQQDDGSFSGVIRIVDSNINLNGGSFEAYGSVYAPDIANDFAGATSAAAIYIGGGSTITTGGAGIIGIYGTGAVADGFDAIGVEINDSTINYGTAISPATGYFNISGNSDVGYTPYAPTTFGAANAYGTILDNGTIINSHTANGTEIDGDAYADNDGLVTGLAMQNATINDYLGQLELHGKVHAETITGDSPSTGEAYGASGVGLEDSHINASNPSAGSSLINISGEVKSDTTVVDNGVLTGSNGVSLDNTQVAASGDTTLLSGAISITGQGGTLVSTSAQNSDLASGVVIEGGSTITNSGLGATTIVGLGGNATGPRVAADGVDLLGVSGVSNVIDDTGGGFIGIAGAGGQISAGDGETFTGEARGVVIGTHYVESGNIIPAYQTNVSTTTGDIAIVAAAGTTSGDAPEGATIDLAGLELNSGEIKTSTSTSGANQLPDGGGSLPPLILIYATDTSVQGGSGSWPSFQAGSPTDYAIKEDPASSLITGNLIMGDYYSSLTAFAPPSVLSSIPTVASFNNFISEQEISLNPTGIIDLVSPLNQITNLDSALVGSGGFNLFDSVSLTVDPIGGTDSADYDQIDQPGAGPVVITMAPNKNLTLTDDSPLTHLTSTEPVISTSEGNSITLITSGTGTFTNQAGAGALQSGSPYVILINSPSQAHLDGITPGQTLYNTSTTASPEENTIAYASSQPPPTQPPPANPTIPPADPGNPNNPSQPTQTAVVNPPPPVYPIVPVLGGNAGIDLGEGEGQGGAGEGGLPGEFPGGNGGVGGNGPGSNGEPGHGSHELAILAAIIEQDKKDGSPVNTGTLDEKWVANTGLSKLVAATLHADLSDGLAEPGINDPLILNLFHQQSDQQIIDALDHAAFGHGHP